MRCLGERGSRKKRLTSVRLSGAPIGTLTRYYFRGWWSRERTVIIRNGNISSVIKAVMEEAKITGRGMARVGGPFKVL